MLHFLERDGLLECDIANQGEHEEEKFFCVYAVDYSHLMGMKSKHSKPKHQF